MRCLHAHGGFDHNAQTLRMVTSLEHRYPEFDGLNLTWELLEGIVKHNGPLTARDGVRSGAMRARRPAGIAEFVRTYELELGVLPSLEAQVAAIADDIAYNAHDIDDGLRAGLFRLDDLKAIPLDRARSSRKSTPAIPTSTEPARRRIGARTDSHLIGDVILEAHRRLGRDKPVSADDVRNKASALIAFPREMAAGRGCAQGVPEDQGCTGTSG